MKVDDEYRLQTREGAPGTPPTARPPRSSAPTSLVLKDLPGGSHSQGKSRSVVCRVSLAG
jgi:hypothetical protein